MFGPRKSLRERNQALVGVVGLVVALAVMVSALNVNRIKSLLGEEVYHADFADAGGARSGDDVRVDGVRVGSVSDVQLDGDRVKISFRAGGVQLGDKTRAEVKSDNALGSKYLAIEPGGKGTVTEIPLRRTDPGYAVSEVLGRLTSNNSEIDVDRVAKSFESLTKVLDASPEEFASALKGVSALSKTVSSRDEELAELLKHASSVSSVLAKRNEQITAILGDGGRIFEEIYLRREAISQVFSEVGRAADQIRGLAADNEKTLRPNLLEINRLAKTLGDYRDTLDYILKTLPRYGRSLGEAVGSGPFFNAYVANLLAPETLANTDGIIKSLLDPDYDASEDK
jgi:phospholipid/cholesterol/gamma-HCH transport system substrate-binding protein